MPAKSDEAKAQRAQRLKVAKIIQEYVNALGHKDMAHVPQPRHTPEQIKTRIESLQQEFALATGVRKVDIAKQLRIAEEQLHYKDTSVDSDLTERFTQVVKQYSEIKGHTVADWLAVGVPKSVLRDAHMLTPTRSANRSRTRKTRVSAD